MRNVEKLEPLCTVGGHTEYDAATKENRMVVPQKLKTELVYDPAIPLLGKFYVVCI